MKFTEMRVETVSVVRCLTRFALCLSWVVFLLALPGRAQTPASEHQTITLEELQQMALLNNPTFKQSAANIQAAEGRKKQSGLYPNPTVGYQGEQMRGGSFHGGEQGFFIQQDIVLGAKLGLNRKIFDQELKQAETEGEEQKLRVVTNVRMSYIQALAAQQTLELRQNLSKLADDAVETSHQLANVGQADTPDVLESEVEAQQAQLAVTMAEQNQQRVWKALATVVGNPRLFLMRLEGKLEDTPPVMRMNWSRKSSTRVQPSESPNSASNVPKQPRRAQSGSRFPTCNSAVACSRMASCCLAGDLSGCRALPTWG
jgi:outer membrane protein TolC